MAFTAHEKIGLRFQEAREAANKTQTDVAEFLHITYQAVSNWERGRTKIDSVSLLKCLLWFNADIYKFLADCDFEIMSRNGSIEDSQERELLNLFYALSAEDKTYLLKYAKDVQALEFARLFFQLSTDEQKLILSAIKGMAKEKK